MNRARFFIPGTSIVEEGGAGGLPEFESDGVGLEGAGALLGVLEGGNGPMIMFVSGASGVAPGATGEELLSVAVVAEGAFVSGAETGGEVLFNSTVSAGVGEEEIRGVGADSGDEAICVVRTVLGSTPLA